MEGYTLAGLPVNAIADKLGLDPEVIRVYEHVMFDVRPRLTDRDTGLGHRLTLSPVASVRCGAGWGGYTDGVYALDAVRAVTTGLRTENYPEALRESIERFQALTQFLAVCTPREFFQLHLRMLARVSGVRAWVNLIPALLTRKRSKNRRSRSPGSPRIE